MAEEIFIVLGLCSFIYLSLPSAGCPVCICRGGSTVRVAAAGDRVSTPDGTTTVMAAVQVCLSY
jgi:hypothetical protein